MKGRLLKRRYRLVDELGRGGMGVVWRAHDERVDRDVAVKVLRAWIAAGADARARFEREARALRRLTHPNIVRLYDFEQSGRGAFLVMELIEGRDLAHAVQGTLPLGLGEASRFLCPVAEGLAFAQSNGIVHRDLKPANVLIATDGRVMISDFGLARVAEGTHSLTATGMLLGSPKYWAPEQAAGRPVTAAGDIYSLGCVLYELLTAHLRFEGDDRLALGNRRVQEDAPDMREYIPDLPATTAVLVGRLLAREPEGRPSASELVELLKNGEPLAATTIAMRQPGRAPDPPTAATFPARRQARTKRPLIVGLVGYPSSRHRRRALPYWLDHYKTRTPHSSLGGRPPISRVRNVCRQDS